jgi:hypothetical protein
MRIRARCTPCGAAAFYPALECVGNELRPVVTTDEPRRWVTAGELLQHHHYVFALAAPAHPDGLAEAAVLVVHDEEFVPSGDGRGVELEVHAPGLVWVLGLVTPHRAVSRASPLLLSGGGRLTLLPPREPVLPLVVLSLAFPPQ